MSWKTNRSSGKKFKPRAKGMDENLKDMLERSDSLRKFPTIVRSPAEQKVKEKLEHLIGSSHVKYIQFYPNGAVVVHMYPDRFMSRYTMRKIEKVINVENFGAHTYTVEGRESIFDSYHAAEYVIYGSMKS